MTKATLLIAAALASLAPLGACGALSPNMKAGEALDESIKLYNEGLRWQRFESAASRIPAVERATFVDEWDQRSKDLKITDYDIVGVEHKDKEAKVQVKLSWYSEGEGTLHETSATQIWERHGSAWFMVDETRLRGTEMPGLPEHSKRDKDKADKAAKDLGKDLGAKDKPDAKADDKSGPTALNP